MLTGPRCGTKETARIPFDGKITLVFGCMFSPTLDDGMSDESMKKFINNNYRGKSDQYLQEKCEEWHFMLKNDKVSK